MGTWLERTTDVAALGAGLAAVVVAGVVVYRTAIDPDLPSVSRPQEFTVPEWQQYADGGHRLGSESAPVTIVEFGDYQCPFCRASEPHLKAIQRSYRNDVALVYRHFPLSKHDFAFPAARAAECAGRQNRFWEFHELLYSTENWFGEASEAGLAELAEQAGMMSAEQFASCLGGSEVDHLVNADIIAGQRLGISGTPSFLVNGRLHVGLLDSLRFAVLFDELREGRQ